MVIMSVLLLGVPPAYSCLVCSDGCATVSETSLVDDDELDSSFGDGSDWADGSDVSDGLGVLLDDVADDDVVDSSGFSEVDDEEG